MTLIVGVQCPDGVVLGADSGATYVAGNAVGPPTAMQPTEKLHSIDDAIIMGVSGAVGLAQLYLNRISTLWSQNLKQGAVTIEDTQRLVTDAIFQDASVAAGRARSILGASDQNWINLVNTHSLLALPTGPERTPTLLQIDFSGRTEAASGDLPFVSIGSGQPIADPFLAFLRRVFWNNNTPTVQDGIFATVWTLQHAINDSASRFSPPVTVAVLDENSARHLTSEEVEDHLQHVDDFEREMRGSRIPERSVSIPPTLSS